MWHKKTSPLDPSSPNWFWEKKKLEREKERERGSNFSLNFSAIGPSNSGGSRSKVAPHGKGYVWALVLWSFDNSGR